MSEASRIVEKTANYCHRRKSIFNKESRARSLDQETRQRTTSQPRAVASCHARKVFDSDTRLRSPRRHIDRMKLPTRISDWCWA